MSAIQRRGTAFMLVVLLLAINYFDFSVQVEPIDFAALEEEVSLRVNDLLNSEKYNLTYFTTFEHGPGNKWDNTTKNGMVVSDDVRCSRAGAFYLEHGGNAMDAAVATSLCLTVVSLASTGLSGGGQSLSYLNGQFHLLDFGGTISKTLISNDNIAVNGTGEVLKIPGMILGMHNLWKQGGKIDWKSLFDIPILIAYNGWDIKPSLRRMLVAKKHLLKKDPFLKSMLFNGDSVKSIGDVIVNKPLAGTLHLLSLNYRSMYEGAIPSTMMQQISPENHAALVSEMGAYATKYIEPLKFDLKDNLEMVTTNKRTGGALLAYILNSMKGYIDRNPQVIHSNGAVDDVYYLALYDSIRNSHFNRENLAFKDTLKVIENAYNNEKLGVLAARKLVSRVFSLSNGIGDEEDDIPGSVTINVIDKCGNAIAMQTAINTLFGGDFSYPPLGIIANTFTILKIGEDLKPIPPREGFMKTYHAPVIVIDKTDKLVNGIFSATGARRIPSGLSQVMLSHYWRHIPLGQAITDFRIGKHYIKNILSEDNETPIPENIVNIITSNRNTTLMKVAMGHDSSVLGIRVTRDENGFPESLFGSGDHRRNSGLKGV